MAAWLCTCGARNRSEYDICVRCSVRRPEDIALPENSKPKFCVVDGDLLASNGYCPRGGGWPSTFQTQPFVCEECRKPLQWSGACLRCSRPGGVTAGSRYDLDDHGHFVLTAKGPQPMFTKAQNQRALAVVRDVLAKRISEADAHDKLDAIAASVDTVPF